MGKAKKQNFYDSLKKSNVHKKEAVPSSDDKKLVKDALYSVSSNCKLTFTKLHRKEDIGNTDVVAPKEWTAE